MFQNAFNTIRSGVKKRRQLNKFPPYMTPAEIGVLEKLLGTDCKALACGAAQLLQVDHEKKLWRTIDAGVACFVKDYSSNDYFIKLYSLHLKTILSEQQIDGTLEIGIHVTEDRLLTFENDSALFGLNFNQVEDARSFKAALEKHRPKRPTPGTEDQPEEEEVEYYSIPNTNDESPPSSSNTSASTNSDEPSPPSQGATNPSKPPRPISFANTVKAHGQHVLEGAAAAASAAAEQMRRVSVATNRKVVQPTSHAVGNFIEHTAEMLGYHPSKKKDEIEISKPMDFQHRAHIGWREEDGFQSKAYVDFDELDPVIQKVLRVIGENPKSVLSREDKAFIYDFVERSGGMDRLKDELIDQHSPAIPRIGGVTKTPPWSALIAGGSPAASPSTNRLTPASSINRPKVPPPPPPPPPPSAPRLPPISSLPPLRPISIVSLAPPANAAPPPPPSPPPPPLPLSSPPREPLRQSIVKERTSMFEQLQRPAARKESKPPVLPKIRETSTSSDPPELIGGIAGALARALAERRQRLESESSTSDHDDEQAVDGDYGEWD